MIKFPKEWTLTGVQTMRTMDGCSLAGKLRHNKKLVADFHDEGMGGEMRIMWHDKAKEKAFTKLCLELLEEYKTPDMGIEEMFSAHEFNKKLKRHMKTKTVFSLPDDEEGMLRTLNLKWGPQANEWMRKNRPTATIYNKE